jgi:hypothetical protein
MTKSQSVRMPTLCELGVENVAPPSSCVTRPTVFGPCVERATLRQSIRVRLVDFNMRCSLPSHDLLSWRWPTMIRVRRHAVSSRNGFARRVAAASHANLREAPALMDMARALCQHGAICRFADLRRVDEILKKLAIGLGETGLGRWRLQPPGRRCHCIGPIRRTRSPAPAPGNRGSARKSEHKAEEENHRRENLWPLKQK